MEKTPKIPSVRECVTLIEFQYCDSAIIFVKEGSVECGENESIEKELVGPIVDEDGFYYWGVLVYVTRIFTNSALNQFTIDT